MTVAPVPGQIDLFPLAHAAPAEMPARGTWVIVAVAVALLCGRAVLWLLLQLLKFLILLALVGLILAVGFEIGSHWDAATGAAAHPAVIAPAGTAQHR